MRSSGESVAVVCDGVTLAAGDGVELGIGEPNAEDEGEGFGFGSGSGGSEDSSMACFFFGVDAAELFFEPPDFFFVAASSGAQTMQIHSVQISQRSAFVFTVLSMSCANNRAKVKCLSCQPLHVVLTSAKHACPSLIL